MEDEWEIVIRGWIWLSETYLHGVTATRQLGYNLDICKYDLKELFSISVHTRQCFREMCQPEIEPVRWLRGFTHSLTVIGNEKQSCSLLYKKDLLKDVNVGGKTDICNMLCRVCKQLLLQHCVPLTMEILTFLQLCKITVPAGKAAHIHSASPPLCWEQTISGHRSILCVKGYHREKEPWKRLYFTQG